MNVLNTGTTRVSRGIIGSLESALTGDTILMAGRITIGLAVVGTGVLGLVVGDFAKQWQPVPEDVPGRTQVAYFTAALLTGLGTGLLVSRNKVVFAASLTAVYLAWTLLLHGPRVVVEPLKITQWLALCEILAMTSGLLVLTASLSADAVFSRWARRVGTLLFATCLPVFGLSHFAYPKFTAEMVPAWIPARLFWAYFTGASHAAAGIAILLNVFAQLGSVLLAVMMSGFVLLLHIPDVISDPDSRHAWTMLCMAMTLTGAAWIVAGSVRHGHAGWRSGRRSL